MTVEGTFTYFLESWILETSSRWSETGTIETKLGYQLSSDTYLNIFVIGKW